MKISAKTRIWLLPGLALLTGIFLWLLCVAFYPFGFGQPDPLCQGKKLSAWANEVFLPLYPDYATNYWTPELHARNDRAVAAIRQIGANALPLAVELCGISDSPLKKWLENVTSYETDDVDVIQYVITPEYEKHRLGGNILLALGPQAEPAIPELIRLLQSPYDSVAVDLMPVLPQISTNIVPPLLRLLDETNETVRLRAAIILGKNFELPVAVPALLEGMTNQNAASLRFRLIMRVQAVQALGSIQPAVPVIVPVLIRQLQNGPDWVMRNSYLNALGKFGTNAASAVPLLLEMAETNQFTPYPALHALQQIDPEAAAPLIKQWQEKSAAKNRP